LKSVCVCDYHFRNAERSRRGDVEVDFVWRNKKDLGGLTINRDGCAGDGCRKAAVSLSLGLLSGE